MQRTEAEIEASRARRRRYMALYMKKYRASPHGKEIIQRQKDRAALRRAAELAQQAQEHDNDKAVT